MITIYGNKKSRAVRTLWMLEELSLPYELKMIDFGAREQKSPEYLALNPNGTVPTLVDNGLTLFESFAINTYLADKYQPELLGLSPEERGQVHQWNYWTVNNLEAYTSAILAQSWEETPDQQVIHKATQMLDHFMGILNNFLKDKTYLVGNHFTIADLDMAAVVNFAKNLNYNVQPFANVTAWLELNLSRPAFQRAVAQ